MFARMSVCVKINREKFNEQDFISEDNVLALVKVGSFRYSCDGVSDVVEAGEALCFLSGVEYHREVISSVEMYLFRFNIENNPFGKEKIIFNDKARIESSLAFLDMLELLVSVDKDTYFESIFLDIVNQYILENKIGFLEMGQNDEKIDEAMRILQRNLKNGIPLSEVASLLKMSYSQFFRRFKAAVGVTPFEYLEALKIKKAKRMLADTDLKIKEIAEHTGFECEYYFSNFFKKNVGMSPSAFRKTVYSY